MPYCLLSQLVKCSDVSFLLINTKHQKVVLSLSVDLSVDLLWYFRFTMQQQLKHIYGQEDGGLIIKFLM